MELSLNCLRCKANMEQGFLLDRGHSGKYSGEWVPGAAQQSDWNPETVKEPQETKKIVAYRCTACGYLEFYAKRR